MSCCYRSFQIIAFILLFVAIGLVVAAGAIDNWWSSKEILSSSERLGLWRTCYNILGSQKCSTRDDIFQFSHNKDFDIILVSLCAIGSCYIASFLLIVVTLCQRFPTKCLLLVADIVTFFGVGVSGFAIAWSFLKVKPNVENFGWGIYCLFAQSGLGVLVFVCLCVLLCMTAPNPYHSTRKDDEMVMLSR